MRRKALLEDAALDPEKWSTLALVKHAETKRKPLNTYLNASYAVKSEVRQCCGNFVSALSMQLMPER
jgi:hypothetical protein